MSTKEGNNVKTYGIITQIKYMHYLKTLFELMRTDNKFISMEGYQFYSRIWGEIKIWKVKGAPF